MKLLHVIPNLAARTGGPPVAVVESSLAVARQGLYLPSGLTLGDSQIKRVARIVREEVGA